jgi:hypothetical protein
MRASVAFLLAPVALCELTGAGAPILEKYGATLSRSIFSAAPLALNTSQYQFVLDPSIKIVGDWDVRGSMHALRARVGGAAAGRPFSAEEVTPHAAPSPPLARRPCRWTFLRTACRGTASCTRSRCR